MDYSGKILVLFLTVSQGQHFINRRDTALSQVPEDSHDTPEGHVRIRQYLRDMTVGISK
jgi:hypothetical protein